MSNVQGCPTFRDVQCSVLQRINVQALTYFMLSLTVSTFSDFNSTFQSIILVEKMRSYKSRVERINRAPDPAGAGRDRRQCESHCWYSYQFLADRRRTRLDVLLDGDWLISFMGTDESNTRIRRRSPAASGLRFVCQSKVTPTENKQ